jgi:hypothetical protein
MRRFLVKMIVETNENPDKEIYYDDREMREQIVTWVDQVFEDRDDDPHRTFAEITQLTPTIKPLLSADTGEINIVRGTE